MDSPLQCMFDTNVFNRIVDGAIQLQAMVGRVVAYATHVQRDEINNTPDVERRAELLAVFENVVVESEPTSSFVIGVSRINEARIGGDRVVPTSSAVWGVSRWGEAMWGSKDDLFSAIKRELDKKKKKANNTQDALIAETAIKDGYVLVTDDGLLADVTKAFGGKCLSVKELIQHCT